jgi:ADP-L-glycero-D-manno-heptose 6-epimerase
MIVVTGASGFLGVNLVRKLNRQGYLDVVAVDDYPILRGARQPDANPNGLRYGDQMMVSGFLDLHDLTNWLERDGSGVEAIIHLGACSDTMVTDRYWVMENNCGYSQRLWSWCERASKPLIYASSAATYGDGSLGYDDEIDPTCYRPLNYYAESKQAFDLWALRQSKAPPRWAGLKYFNVFGPREHHKGRMASVVFHGFCQIGERGAIQLFQSHREGIADGGQARDFIHVSDAVDATLHFLDPVASDDAQNGLYNVGTGTARTFADLGRAIFAALGLEPRIQYIPMPVELRARYQYFTQAKIDKLHRAGFVQPMLSLEEGVSQYVQQYLLREARAA